MLYKFPPNPTKLIKKAEVLKQISWEKAGTIYKNQQDLLTLQLTKNESMIKSNLESISEYNQQHFENFSFQEFWLLASLSYIENMK